MQTFICYSRKDSEFVDRLTRDLEERAIPTWRDIDQIPRDAGARTAGWRSAVDRALRESTHMIVVLSPDSVASDECAAEWNYFLQHGKPVIPVLYRETEIPYRLLALQYWDLRADYTRKLDLLAQVMPEVDKPGETGIEQLQAARSKRPSPLLLIGGGLALIILLGLGALQLVRPNSPTPTPDPATATLEPTGDPVIVPSATDLPSVPTPDDAATATAVVQERVAAVQQSVRDFDREMRRALEEGDYTRLSRVARSTALTERIEAVDILIRAGDCHWVYNHRSITPHQPIFTAPGRAELTATVDRDGYVMCRDGKRDEYSFTGPRDSRYTVELYEDGWVVTEFKPATPE